ncbi:MAG: hypothetical protein ACKPKO_00025, partial [Candidatus Fonsibacter sp.]
RQCVCDSLGGSLPDPILCYLFDSASSPLQQCIHVVLLSAGRLSIANLIKSNLVEVLFIRLLIAVVVI